MKHNFTIPVIMEHLPLDERGYPIPYFAPLVDGKYDFRYQDPHKKEICLKYNKCSVCGKPLFDKSFWFITGPIGLANQVVSDAPMHEDCGRFSMEVCPHLQFQKAERRSEEEIIAQSQQAGIMTKPNVLFLIKADKYKLMFDHIHIKFRPVKTFRYEYKDNRLTQSEL